MGKTKFRLTVNSWWFSFSVTARGRSLWVAVWLIKIPAWCDHVRITITSVWLCSICTLLKYNNIWNFPVGSCHGQSQSEKSIHLVSEQSPESGQISAKGQKIQVLNEYIWTVDLHTGFFSSLILWTWAHDAEIWKCAGQPFLHTKSRRPPPIVSVPLHSYGS